MLKPDGDEVFLNRNGFASSVQMSHADCVLHQIDNMKVNVLLQYTLSFLLCFVQYMHL